MKKILLFTFVFITSVYNTKSQSCIPTTINGSIVNLACGQPCTSFAYQVPHLKSTTDYVVTAIAHTPYPNASGTPIPSIYIDDKYSPLIPMSFPFCFYNMTYNDIIVGSNGLVTFETICANASNAYTLTVGGLPQPLPYAGGAGPTGIANTYYPRTAIMGGYQDIDPSVNPLATRRIEYNVFGTAPCRKFVISFVDIRLFSCTNLIQTSQIVLHESTGLIEVFLKDKPMCPTWPSGAGAGLGILGIQDETRTKFQAAPGKNCTQWSESNKGYRFTPNGGTSNFVSAQLFTLTGTFIANGDTATTTPGILDISFPNICPPNVPSTKYVIRTTFNSCTATPLISSDTVTFNRVTSLPATTSTVATTCGASTGSITVTPTAGTSPYTYTLNGGSTVTVPGAHTYSGLAAGPYVVRVVDANGCDSIINAIITTTTTITATATSTATSCPLSATGTITVTPTSGTAPYTYRLDGGAPQASNVFTNVAAGAHVVTFIDNFGCTGSVNVNVAAGNTPLTANITSTATSCPLSPTGTITVTPTSGTAPYTYRLDGGAPQGSNVFINVTAGAHSVTFTDAMGCTGTITVNVAAGNTPLTATVNSTATLCPLSPTGTITVTPTSGTAPYTYRLDGGAPQGSNIFINVTAGAHTVTFTDVMGCTGSISVNVAAGTTPLTALINAVATSCPLSSDGTITVTPTSGTAPYTYSLDGGAFQASNVFTNVAIGPHTVIFRDVMGCTGSVSVNVVAGSTPLTATVNSTATSCPLSADGTITITPTSGTAPYTYSLNGAPPQAGNVFTNVSAGTHTVMFTDNFGCTGSVSINVVAGSTPLTASINSTPTTCPTLNDGTITVTPTSGTAPYQYRLDGGPPQSSNIFTNVAAGAHSVSVTDMFGCTGTFSINVAMGSSLTSAINGGNPPCFNVNDGTITINPTSGTAPYMYSLNGGPAQGSNVFSGLAAGSYTVTFTDVNGCTGTNSITLTTNTAITATSVLTNPLCNGTNNGSITLNASGGVAPYQYSINAGAIYQASPVFNSLIAGTYNFLIRDVLGCIYGFTFSLTEPTTLSASALTNFATCPNNDGSLNITAGGGTPGYEYSINNGINYQPGNTFSNLPSGNYNNIKVRDANGCITNTTAVVILNDTMRLDLGADSTICFGSSITLIPQTNALTDTFKWTPAATLNFDTARTPIASPTDTTKYYVTAKWGVCVRKDSITVNVLHKPVPYAGRDTTICYKTNAFLRGSASNLSGTVNYAWSPPDSLNTPNAATTIARMDTTRKFFLTVTDNYGCNFSVTDSMTVFMQPLLVVFAGNDTNAVLGRPHQLLASGGVNYVWSPVGPLNNPFIANPLATLQNDTYFHVLVTDAIGCTDDDSVFIKVYEGPMYYLPNAFTPNGDGLNDVFRPIPVGIRSTDYFRVFNRYGAVMFETKEWMKGWDGTIKGKPSVSGTYVWMIKGIDKNGTIVEMKGSVILIR